MSIEGEDQYQPSTELESDAEAHATDLEKERDLTWEREDQLHIDVEPHERGASNTLAWLNNQLTKSELPQEVSSRLEVAQKAAENLQVSLSELRTSIQAA